MWKSWNACVQGQPLPALLACALLPMSVMATTTTVDPEVLDAIVVTAPAPADGITWETDPKLPRQPVPASDGADYLKTIPGFGAIRNGGSNGDPVLRGMMGSRLNLLSNGGAMPGACPSRMDNPMSYVAPETFDRLVVVKGPQTVLWGPGASAGTVRFERDIRRDGSEGAQVFASVLAGSNARRDGVLDASVGNRHGHVRASGNHSEADDYRAGDGSRVPALWNKWSADAALAWTPDEHSVLELGLGQGDGEARYAGRGMDGVRFDRDSTSLRFERTGMSGVLRRVEASVYRNDVDHLMDNYSLRQPSPAGSMPMPMASNVARRTEGGRVAASLVFEHGQLDAGIDAQDSRHRRRSAMGRGSYAQKPWLEDARLRNLGIFAEAGIEQDSHTRWVAGARVDQATARDLRAPAPPVGALLALPERQQTLGSGFLRRESAGPSPWSWFAGLGHARRMPDYWELFSPSQGPQGAVNAFSAIQPERTTQIDAGLQYRARRFDAWISAYAGRIDDYILFDYLPAGGMNPGSLVTRVENVAARIHGAEAGIELRPHEAIKLDAALAWAWGENRDAGTALPQMPPLELRLGAAWEAERWTVGMLWRGVAVQQRIAPGQGSVVGRDIDASPGFGTLALNASLRLGSLWWLSAGIDNLFDRSYSEHLNLAGSADFGYPAEPVRIAEPGRNLWLKLDLRY